MNSTEYFFKNASCYVSKLHFGSHNCVQISLDSEGFLKKEIWKGLIKYDIKDVDFHGFRVIFCESSKHDIV